MGVLTYVLAYVGLASALAVASSGLLVYVNTIIFGV